MNQRSSGRWIFPTICAATTVAAAAAHLGVGPIGPLIFATVLGGWIISLCLHEFAHAATALAGGDTSVRTSGYLTLNPARYVDTANSILIPVILLAIGGIPLPGGAVRVQPGRFRYRWWSTLVSAAGPATNIVLGAALAVIAAPFDSALGAALSFLALLQFIAGILNLLPIPGFDGYGMVAPYLPPALTRAVGRYATWLPLAAFAVIFFVPAVTAALFDAGFALLSLSGGNELAARVGAGLFQFWR